MGGLSGSSIGDGGFFEAIEKNCLIGGKQMILKCLASGSSGNCYLLECREEVLILDCGIPIKQIKQGLNWNLGGIEGVVVTHAHT